MPECIVVGGPPCAGKSTLARTIEARGGWPVLAKDDCKELVFDRLGARDDAWSRAVGELAWDLLFREAELLLTSGASCVVEGNFRPEHGARLRRIAERAQSALALRTPEPTRVRFVEIRCHAAGPVLVERFRARAERGERHPGHADAEALARIAPVLASASIPALELGGAVLDYDTSAGFAPAELLAALDAVLPP
jgi:predicted kinase